MKRIFLCALGMAAFAAALWADPPARVGRLSYLDGTVSFSSTAGGAWEPATLNYPLTAANQLSTEASSRAEVHVGSSAARLAPDSSITFEALDDQAVQVRLDRGWLSVRLRELAADEGFQVDTQTASIALSAPGSYRIEQLDSGGAAVITWEGDAMVTGGMAAFHVGPGQMASARYASREMDGIEDLDSYGSWRITAGYGPVWVPEGVTVEWAPYMFGRWAWIDPWGWTWVDEEPWGFAPFHYGRWVFVTGSWCWVPGPIVVRPVFAPALVRWVGGTPWRGQPPDRDHISWVPLRPWQPFRPSYSASSTYIHALNGVPVSPRSPPVPRPRAPGMMGREPAPPYPPPAYRPGIINGGPVPPARPYFAPPGTAQPQRQPGYPRGPVRRPPRRAPDGEDPDLWPLLGY